ncbi:hypothetical protein CC79DRAFT_817168 [Sarocladium strictum]
MQVRSVAKPFLILILSLMMAYYRSNDCSWYLRVSSGGTAPSVRLAELARYARQMPLKETARWRIKVIAAYPLAPVCDKKGLRSQALAQESMSRSLQITAYLDPDATHSSISYTLAAYLLGDDGLKLAKSTAHGTELGQVGTILSCDDSKGTQTESFLLGDLDGIDMLLSQPSWMSLERQCDDFSFSHEFTTSIDSWFTLSSAPRSYSEEVQGPAGDVASCAFFGTPETGSSREPSEKGSHTPCSTSDACPSPLSHSEEPKDMTQTFVESNRNTPDLSLREYHIPYRIAHRSDSRPTGQDLARPSQPSIDEKSPYDGPEINVWSWDSERQNYYCRDRDEDDEWYWYPADIV